MFHVIDTTIVNSYIMYKHYYKMLVQFSSPRSLNQWIHCFLIKSWQVNHNQVNSYIKAHMTWLDNSMKTMSHLKFNVDLVKAIIKKKERLLLQRQQW
jgi:hypothetical protein